MNEDYNSGRWGTGNPNYNNWDWQKGNQERLNEINRQQEAQRAAESKRIQESAKAWSDAMKPRPSPWSGQSQTSTIGTGGMGAGSGSSLGSGGGGYRGTSLSDGLGNLVLAPFKLAWALIKFAVIAIICLIVFLVLVYIARLWMDHGATPPSAPSTTTSRVLPPETPAPPTQAPSGGEVAEPTQTAPAVDIPSAEVPAEATVPDLSRPARIGVWDRDFSTKDASRLALDPSMNGVIIDSVLAGSPAADIGLQPDDVIVSLNNQAVATSDELIQLVRSQLPGAEIPIVFYRNGVQYSGSITPRSEQ